VGCGNSGGRVLAVDVRSLLSLSSNESTSSVLTFKLPKSPPLGSYVFGGWLGHHASTARPIQLFKGWLYHIKYMLIGSVLSFVVIMHVTALIIIMTENASRFVSL
jgi:hypothetical protein